LGVGRTKKKKSTILISDIFFIDKVKKPLKYCRYGDKMDEDITTLIQKAGKTKSPAMEHLVNKKIFSLPNWYMMWGKEGLDKNDGLHPWIGMIYDTPTLPIFTDSNKVNEFISDPKTPKKRWWKGPGNVPAGCC
jgi:hypothetical protein